MGGLIPLSDVSRQPTRIPAFTILIILINQGAYADSVFWSLRYPGGTPPKLISPSGDASLVRMYRFD